MNLKGGKSQVLCTVPKSSYKYFDVQRFCGYALKLYNSGCKFTTGKMFVYAVIGSVSLWPKNAYCADGFHMISEYPLTFSSHTSNIGETLRRTMLLIGKLIVPLFVFLTVWLNWGQSDPIYLAAEVALIFLCTKPIPSSVYIFVNQLQRRMMSQQPFLYRFKPLQLRSVDIKDYIFLCVARVELKDEQHLLVGILGSWWIFPPSWKKVFVFDMSSWKELISVVKSVLRLDTYGVVMDVDQ
ncbi:hypothetical protein CDL12_05462 [Handroanthus impetiginosus]|uniref:Uncharacterized protein n=1 Tax=Handroanthus impetiginosus TaxID=429701 RepID=A0A2G9HWF4_9LAMI|nr:hypothetical protein CDL12_05462 [Handroanthus impetiginosus]